MSEKPYVAVIGGMNMDIFGIPDEKVIPRDSNIGQIGMAVGALGRILLRTWPARGANVSDYRLRRRWRTVSSWSIHALSTAFADYAEKLTGQRSSGYLYVTDETGDMLLGINDRKIQKTSRRYFWQSGSTSSITRPCMITPTRRKSRSVAWRARDGATLLTGVNRQGQARHSVLDKIDTLKPNRIEAEMMTGIKITDCETAQIAAKLLEYGVKNVFISLGRTASADMSNEQSARANDDHQDRQCKRSGRLQRRLRSSGAATGESRIQPSLRIHAGVPQASRWEAKSRCLTSRRQKSRPSWQGSGLTNDKL